MYRCITPETLITLSQLMLTRSLTHKFYFHKLLPALGSLGKNPSWRLEAVVFVGRISATAALDIVKYQMENELRSDQIPKTTLKTTEKLRQAALNQKPHRSEMPIHGRIRDQASISCAYH